MFKKIILYNKRLNNMRQELKINNKSLLNGTYVTFENFAFLKRDKHNVLLRNVIPEIISQNKFKRIFKKMLVKNTRISSNEKGKIKGSFIIVTRNNNIKIFDLHKNLVLNTIKSKDKYYQFKKNYYYYKEHFSLPKIYNFNDHTYSFIEEKIEFINYKDWNEQQTQGALNDIYSSYNTYLSKKGSNMLTDYTFKKFFSKYKSLLKDLQFNNLLNRIEENLDELSLPFVNIHGDLCIKNILLTNMGSVKIIDWEHSGQYTFFYDFYNLMFVEALDKGEYSFIKRYFKGEYDLYLNEIFKLFHLQFNSKLRLTYLSCYIFERIINRDMSKDILSLETSINNYKTKIYSKCSTYDKELKNEIEKNW